MEKTNNFLEVIKRKNGERLTSPLSKGEHLLISGVAGSGKSVLQRNMALSLIENYSSDDINLGLISIGKDSFSVFRDSTLPHLLTSPISSVEEAKNFISEIKKEIQKRMDVYEDKGAKSIEDYREKIAKMPYIYICRWL